MTTHVANAMGVNILAKASSEKWVPVKRNYTTDTKGNFGIDTKGEIGINAPFKAITASASNSLSASASAAHSMHNYTEEVYKAIEDGFVRINPGNVVPFDGVRLFITILTEKGVPACTNYQVPNDRSIIVKGDHGIVLAEYGSLWIDGSGKKYH